MVETKVYSDTVQFAEGKTQLAYYIKNLNLTTGVYLVLIINPKIIEGTDTIDGVEIKTDFKDKKRKKNQEDDDDD